MKKLILIPLIFLLSFSGFSQWTKTAKPKGSTACYFGYQEIMPDNYAGEKLPVVIFFHGTGEHGNGTTELSKVLNTGLPRYLNNIPEKAIIICPQQPWPGWMNSTGVGLVLDYVLKTYNVDEDRVYVTGLSAGAQATFKAAYDHRSKIDAVLACAIRGYVNADNWDKPKGLPVHIVTNESDAPADIKGMIEGLTKAGAILTTDIKPGYSHNSWDRCYSNPENLKWLFAQGKTVIEPQPQPTINPLLLSAEIIAKYHQLTKADSTVKVLEAELKTKLIKLDSVLRISHLK